MVGSHAQLIARWVNGGRGASARTNVEQWASNSENVLSCKRRSMAAKNVVMMTRCRTVHAAQSRLIASSRLGTHGPSVVTLVALVRRHATALCWLLLNVEATHACANEPRHRIATMASARFPVRLVTGRSGASVRPHVAARRGRGRETSPSRMEAAESHVQKSYNSRTAGWHLAPKRASLQSGRHGRRAAALATALEPGNGGFSRMPSLEGLRATCCKKPSTATTVAPLTARSTSGASGANARRLAVVEA